MSDEEYKAWCKSMSEVCKETTRLCVGAMKRAMREEEEFFKSWDKRAAEVKELKRMMDAGEQ